MIAFVIWSSFAFVVGYITRAITHRPGHAPNLYVSWQPSDIEMRRFKRTVDRLDIPTVTRRKEPS